ncbi:predicted protein [Sclerotinia sclerotiorum 1980 UF-70]|uniref:Uncharacterized protein n=1 Tax=Sclerotinia sclerotiorum (strain ATCC 18683 / 1980 / Ss-1) TaxID=665079 RepID=A7EGT6_SCLS1|nr:predicted protein [Sclerotinia sclerotiorum 1980 UF-70]EDO02052.1 predicted protein [Sclerotinia sclerotiorum 1980 UF-70]
MTLSMSIDMSGTFPIKTAIHISESSLLSSEILSYYKMQDGISITSYKSRSLSTIPFISSLIVTHVYQPPLSDNFKVIGSMVQ